MADQGRRDELPSRGPIVVATFVLVPERPIHEVRSSWLHAVASELLERPLAVDHGGSAARFALRPVELGDDGAFLAVTWLAEEAPDRALDRAVGATARIGPVPVTVAGVRAERIEWSAVTTDPPARAIEIEFLSPTYFSRSGRDTPLPDPVLVVRSLGRRWDDLAPPWLRLGADRRRAVEDAIALSAFAGETVRAGGHQVGDRTGFVGVARFVLVGRVDDVVAGDLSTLARFAELAGVGARTGHGFGAVRVLAWG